MNKISSRRHPTFVVQMIALTLSVLAVLCYFLPFANLKADKALGLLDSFVNKSDGKGSTFLGIEGILMPLSNDTIHKSLDIGPLPTNPYLLTALVFAMLAVAVYFVKKLTASRFLIAAILDLLAAVCLIVFPFRFTQFYGKFTKNGGAQFETLLNEGQLVMTIQFGLILCAVFLFLAFMFNLLLYGQLKHDPLCRTSYIDG